MRTVAMLLAAIVCASAQAQQNPAAAPAGRPPQAVPSPDQLEPAVDTTATTTPDAAPAAAAARGAAARGAAARGAAARGTAAAGVTPKGDRTPAVSKPAGAAGETAGSAKVARGAKGPDRVELETTEITGNRELPKVLYIVPWKRSDLGDLVGKPANSLLDEVLQPIDRDVFLRENRYYDAVRPDVPRPKAGTVPGSGDKP
jgi:hypothetical protein